MVCTCPLLGQAHEAISAAARRLSSLDMSRQTLAIPCLGCPFHDTAATLAIPWWDAPPQSINNSGHPLLGCPSINSLIDSASRVSVPCWATDCMSHVCVCYSLQLDVASRGALNILSLGFSQQARYSVLCTPLQSLPRAGKGTKITCSWLELFDSPFFTTHPFVVHRPPLPGGLPEGRWRVARGLLHQFPFSLCVCAFLFLHVWHCTHTALVECSDGSSLGSIMHCWATSL